MNTINYNWRGERYRCPARDSQRAKLYAAEREAFGDAFRRLHGAGELVDAERYVRRVTSSSTWLRLATEHGQARAPEVEVADGRGCRMARGGSGYVTLPRWARTEPVMLHELAHCLTCATFVVRDGAAGGYELQLGARHNWPFARAYLDLVSMFLGRDAADRLKASFWKHHVKFNPPKRLSPEALAKLRARGHSLAAARRQPQGESQ